MEKLQSKMYHVLFCGRIIWVCGLQSPYVTRACIDDWLTRSSPKAKTEPHMAVLLRHSTCHCDGSPPPGTSLCWFKSRGKVCVVGAGAQTRKRRQLGRTSKRWRGVGGFFLYVWLQLGEKEKVMSSLMLYLQAWLEWEARKRETSNAEHSPRMTSGRKDILTNWQRARGWDRYTEASGDWRRDTDVQRQTHMERDRTKTAWQAFTWH